MTKLYDALSGAGIKSMTGIGIYYDDPAMVSGQNMKSEVGSVISQSDFSKLNKKSSDYTLKVIEGGDKVVVEFPYKNTLSYMV
jgi:DNA gyrase inhibitor GyrI